MRTKLVTTYFEKVNVTLTVTFPLTRKLDFLLDCCAINVRVHTLCIKLQFHRIQVVYCMSSTYKAD